MKKTLPLLTAIFLFAGIPAVLTPQAQSQKTMPKNGLFYGWVTSPEGLRIRDSPSLDGKKTGALPYGAKVLVQRTGADFAEIDAIPAKWFYVTTGNSSGWVFGGYISVLDPALRSRDQELAVTKENLAQGGYNWYPENARYVKNFDTKNGYREEIPASSYIGIGTYTLSGKTITITIRMGDDEKNLEDSRTASGSFSIVSLRPNKLVLDENGKKVVYSRPAYDTYRYPQQRDFLESGEKWLAELNTRVTTYFFKNYSLLMYALDFDQAEVAIALINSSVDVNWQDSSGVTALHRLAKSFTKNPELNRLVLRALINKKAEINPRDSSGKTPLDYLSAAKTGSQTEKWHDALELLKSYGAKSGGELKSY